MTIFSRIIHGSIPCHRIFENDRVISFLDVHPLSPGHALVVPKEEKAFLHELSAESAAALGCALPLIAKAVMDSTGAAAYNILQNNGAIAHQLVMHVHFHVIPKYEDGRGLGLVWNGHALDPVAAAAMAADIASRLR